MAGVYAADCGDVLVAEPLAKAFDSVVVAELAAVIRNHQTAHVNLFRLETVAHAPLVPGHGRNAVIAYYRVTYTEDLPLVRRVSEALGVSHHGGRKDQLAGAWPVVAETHAFHAESVLQYELGFIHPRGVSQSCRCRGFRCCLYGCGQGRWPLGLWYCRRTCPRSPPGPLFCMRPGRACRPLRGS